MAPRFWVIFFGCYVIFKVVCWWRQHLIDNHSHSSLFIIIAIHVEILVIIECQMPISAEAIVKQIIEQILVFIFCISWHCQTLHHLYLEQTKRACVVVFFGVLSWKPLLMSPAWATQLFPSNSLLMFLSAFAPKAFLALVLKSLSIVQGGLRWTVTQGSKTRTDQGVIRMSSYQDVILSGCYLIREFNISMLSYQGVIKMLSYPKVIRMLSYQGVGGRWRASAGRTAAGRRWSSHVHDDGGDDDYSVDGDDHGDDDDAACHRWFSQI